MPTVLCVAPYRFYFYAGDRDEPPNVHVERDRHTAKFWLEPVRLQKSGGFSSVELNRIQRLLEKHREALLREWNDTLIDEPRVVAGENVKVTADALFVELSDGRTITAPLAWFPRLLHGTAKERNHWRFIGRGEGIHWPDLDEDISIEGLVMGKPSGENQSSFARWLEKRGKQLKK